MSDQIDVNAIANTLQTKVDLPTGKSQADIDYVVEFQRPTSSNNYTWYRLYKSGWIEQGGTINVTADGTVLTFLKPFVDTNYTMTAAGTTRQLGNIAFYDRTATSVKCWTSDDETFNASYADWEAKGFAAQS